MNSGKKIVLLGGGGHCKSVLDTLLRIDEYEEIVITDSTMPAGSRIMDVEVVGTDAKLEELRQSGFSYAFITVGSIKSTEIRQKLYERAVKTGYKIPIVVDPSAIISESAEIGEGTFVGKGAIINAEAKIGKMAIINSKALIEHECIIGDFSHVAVAAVLCGRVEVGESVFVGANATVIQCEKIAGHEIVVAGETVRGNK